MIWVLLGLLGFAGLFCGCIKLTEYIDDDDVPPWRKFHINCPVCRKPMECWKRTADKRVADGFGVRNLEAPKCKRCDADLAEPYMRHSYVAALVAEAKRAEQFKTVAAEYNAAIKTARKGAAA